MTVKILKPDIINTIIKSKEDIKFMNNLSIKEKQQGINAFNILLNSVPSPVAVMYSNGIMYQRIK